MAVSEQLANDVVGGEQRLIARAVPDNRKLAGPGELGVVGIEVKAGRRRNDDRMRLQEGVAPVLLGREAKRGTGQLVARGVVCAELLARADRTVVPVVDAIAIEVRLADLGPVLAGVGAGVGVFIEALPASRLKDAVAALVPAWVNAAQSRINGVRELMDRDALVVVAIERQAQQILFAEARRPAARAANAFVLIGGIGMIAILGHVGINLIPADNDQVHALLLHSGGNIRPAGEHVRDDLVSSDQR